MVNSWWLWVTRVKQLSFSEVEWICGDFYMRTNVYSHKLLIFRTWNTRWWSMHVFRVSVTCMLLILKFCSVSFWPVRSGLDKSQLLVHHSQVNWKECVQHLAFLRVIIFSLYLFLLFWELGIKMLAPQNCSSTTANSLNTKLFVLWSFAGV